MFDFAGIPVGFVLLILLVLVTIWKSIVIVPNKSVMIVERLGKYLGAYEAGLHFLIPFLDRVAYVLSLKEQTLDVPKQSCITKDNVSISIDGVLYIQVVNPEKAVYGVEDYLLAASQLAQTSMRSVIGGLELDKTFEERVNINSMVLQAVDNASLNWGVKVLRYEIRDIQPPVDIAKAMEMQMRAEREKRALVASSEGDREAAINRAEGEQQALIKIAEGQKAAAIAASEGECMAMKNRAEGEAALIEKVAEATAKSIVAVAASLQAEGGMEALNLRVAESYIEQFGKMAKEANTLIVPSNLTDISGTVASLATVITKAKPVQGS